MESLTPPKTCRGNRFVIWLFLAIFFSSLSVSAQGLTVSGTVKDEAGDPLVGATVMVKGSATGIATDLDGKFTVRVNNGKGVLVVSYLGYDTQEVKIGNRSNLNIVLKENATNLDDVVVIGYARQKKATVAAAVSSVDNKDLIRSTSSTTAGALVGKVSGITARQKDGAPGSAASIQIRNMGTPLYVIDGVMRDEEAFNSIDIHDIANISILKDGAAAIYGVKAANGVVLVTTKQGSSDTRPRVSVNANVGWQQWTEYPELLDAYQWNYGNYMKAVNDGNLVGDEAIANAKSELDKWKSGYYNPQTGEDYRGYDWYHNFVRQAAPQYYVNANVSGGSDKFDYYLSVGHINQEAVFKDYSYSRTNMQGNFNMKLSNRFKVGLQVQGKIATNRNPALPGSDDYYEMKQGIFNLIPTQRPYANDNPNYLNNISPTHDAAHNLAAYTIENAGEYKKRVQTLNTTFNVQYDTPLEGLIAKGLLSYSYYGLAEDNNEKSWSEYKYDHATDTYNSVYTKSSTYRGKMRNTYYELNGQFTLNYDHIFANDHHVTAVAGFEFYKQDISNLNVWQQPVENPFVNLIKTNENNKVSNTARNITTASWIFRAGYSFRNKYIVDFAGRYDASWRFQKGHQWGFFPSVSAAWRLSQEEFFKEGKISDWLSDVKIRGSYGEMGDDMAVNYYSSYPDFAYMQGYTFGTAGSLISGNPLNNGGNTYYSGSSYNGIPQTGLTWMKISMLDFGIDLGFLNDRLRFEFDVFRRRRSGIPATPTDVIYPYEAGYSAMMQNLNSDEIRGLDLSIKWNDRINDFNYYVGANFTLARQKTLDNYGETFLNAWDKYRWAQTDRWANVKKDATWMYETIGVFKTQEEIDNYPVDIDGANNRNLRPGDLIFKDINGDGVINEFDERPLGYAATDYAWDRSNANKQPLISMGINLGFEWKGLDFGADFAGAFLNTFVADWHVKYGIGSDQTGYVYNVIDTWHHEDIFDPTSPWVEGKFPAVRSNNPSIRWWNDFYSKTINYFRLRNLVVGYTLPQKWTQKAYISKLRVYFEGTNLFCWDSLEDYGFDPEISSVTGFDYPQHRVFSIGLNVTF